MNDPAGGMTNDHALAAPIIVSALFAPSDQAWLDGLRRAHFPPEHNHLAAHLTLFHHLPPTLEEELARRLSAATNAPPPEARLAGVMNLGRGTALRVDSAGLLAIRADLVDAFAGTLTPQDRAGWRPHVTIQNKVSSATATALQEILDNRIAGRPIAIVALAAWHYRGGPWQLIARHPFRR